MPAEQAYAPPGIFGPWVDLYSHTGEYSYEVSWFSVSNAPANLIVEIRYATNSGYKTYETTGEGSYTITGNDGAGPDQIRFKSTAQGQDVRVSY